MKEEAGTLSLSDHNFVWLVLCLASLTNRALSGIYILDNPQSEPSEWDEEIDQFAKKLSARINRQFGVRLPESETIQLTCLMNKAAIRKSVTRLLSENQAEIRTSERLSEEFGSNILSLAEEIVTYASVYLHPALRVDGELLTNLANHLYHLPYAEVSRAKLRNPLLADIRREYAHIYLIAEHCADIVYRHFNSHISEDEIGYLTMYFAAAMERLCISERKKKVLVICNAGRATAMLLVSRIRVEFPNIDIVGVMSYLEWKNRVDSIEYDLIVSTIPVQVKDTPVVIASPLLASQDAANIRTVLKTPRTTMKAIDRIANHNRFCLKNLIKADTIKLNVLVGSWEEAVEQAGEPLLKNHLIEHRYIQAMKDTIINFGPYMVIWEGTALLHARPEDGVRQLCMGFTTFRNPINFGHEQNDPVKMAFVLGAVDNCSHMPALYELSDLMQDHEVAASLRNTVSPQRVLKLLAEHCKEPA
jgi:mannitol operon transcriptional antiterminator